MMKKFFYRLSGAGIFLLDESLKNYVEENLQPGTEKKLTSRIVLRRVHNQGWDLNFIRMFGRSKNFPLQ